MLNYQWKSSIAAICQEYISLQRVSGFSFKQQEIDFQKFDNYYFSAGYTGTNISKELIDKFIYTKHAAPSTYRRKEILLNNFCIYMDNRGFKVYVPPVKTQVKFDRHIPHIYTKDELKRFFDAIKDCPDGYKTRKSVDLLLFRVLYGTGMRISEALNLRVSDFDRGAGTLTILHSKNNRSRIVPLHPTLSKQLDSFVSDFHNFSESSTPLFPNIHMTKLNHSAVYERFKTYLLMADIPRTGNGPRIHDFRHGFAVENLRKWSVEGKDLLNLIPYLSTYLGHVDYKATQYYLRLTAEIYPDIIAIIEDACEEIIPKEVNHNEY